MECTHTRYHAMPLFASIRTQLQWNNTPHLIRMTNSTECANCVHFNTNCHLSVNKNRDERTAQWNSTARSANIGSNKLERSQRNKRTTTENVRHFFGG